MAVLVGCIVRSNAMCINRGVRISAQAWRPKPTVGDPSPATGLRRRTKLGEQSGGTNPGISQPQFQSSPDLSTSVDRL